MKNDPTSSPDDKELRVLLLPPTRRDAEAIQQLLTDSDIFCLVCPTVAGLCDEVDRGAGAILIAEESLTADPDSFIQCIASQPVWSDLPTIVLSRSGIELPKLTAVLPLLGNVNVLERPVRITTLLSLVRSSLRGRQRQYEVRSHMLEQRRIEQQLRSSEERLRLAVQTGKLGIWELDLPSGQLTCSTLCKAIFGRAPDDRFNHAEFCAAMHPDDAENVKTTIRDSIDRHADYEIEYRNLWPDASIHWVLVRGHPTYAVDGTPQRLINIALDVTSRKTAEEQHASLLESERAARAQAEHAGRMKDEFLATLSHELRTPLNAILGWSQLLSRETRDENDLNEGIRAIERNARAQTQIIEDLLDMSRIISGKVRIEMKRVDLSRIIQASVDTVRPAAAAKSVHLHVILDPLAGPICGDANRLQQVFWNLLSNAVKFTPPHQRVQVHLQQVRDQLVVHIIDTGEGISPDFLPYVFDRFRQADASTARRHGGLGLGLAIVKQLVELHGGSVHAHSPGPGLGATFTVSFPLLDSHAQPDTLDPLPEPQLEKLHISPAFLDEIRDIKVLIVDDESDSRAVVTRLLEWCGASVSSASSAREALHILQTARPDVLISDIGMPVEDGYFLIRRVRALPPQQGGLTPAIALTAYTRPEDRESILNAGFQSHVAKPVEPAELIASIANLSARSR